MIIVSIPYAVIKKTIDEWDPIGLLITHAPADEYDSESNRIYDRLNELSYASIETLANIIFEAFIKSNKYSESESRGLGLYLCSEIIKDHGGSIDIINGEKVTVRVDMPLSIK